jgi:hypothetical protein
MRVVSVCVVLRDSLKKKFNQLKIKCECCFKKKRITRSNAPKQTGLHYTGHIECRKPTKIWYLS